MTDEDHAKIVREARVTQADCDAARPFMDHYLDGSSFADDRADLALAFTRHRLAAEAAAFEKAAGVADEQTRLNVQARIDRADDELAFQFRGLGNVIATAIRKLAGEKHD